MCGRSLNGFDFILNFIFRSRVFIAYIFFDSKLKIYRLFYSVPSIESRWLQFNKQTNILCFFCFIKNVCSIKEMPINTWYFFLCVNFMWTFSFTSQRKCSTWNQNEHNGNNNKLTDLYVWTPAIEWLNTFTVDWRKIKALNDSLPIHIQNYRFVYYVYVRHALWVETFPFTRKFKNIFAIEHVYQSHRSKPSSKLLLME